ncbi:hypothetical protein P13BB106kb_p069 [Pectobacterium phage DU_PP_V]|uniref:Uncharacterized protein n=1 Tax=Pectobacterium phage DU_PP_V TaxID=2041492 RepID=A0A2D2W752_9CAUD|nr:hypothetical protein HOS40_gp100 [Pectobacterium phage DU_PP_V]ATS94053.1 hypothetical protein P13BB106kb_p069 [Pectobacterium phage DU_PP_V]
MAKSKNTKTVVVKDTSKTEANRARRLARHLKAHPNDAQTAKAVKSFTPRAKPQVKGSTKSRAKARLVAFVAGYGHKSVPVVTGTYLDNEFYPKGTMAPKDYTRQMSSRRRELSKFIMEQRATFGSVKPNLFGKEYDAEDARAICFHLGIKRSSSKPRRKSK